MSARAQRKLRYVVTFFKTVTDDCGHDREICQRTIEVAAADKGAALSEAAAEFCRLDGISGWSLHADRYEVSNIDQSS
jgi:hypothetical protein